MLVWLGRRGEGGCVDREKGMTYPDDYINKVICGDNLEVMKGIPDKSVDLVLTDPPFFAPASHYQSRISWGRCWGDLSILGQAFFDWCKEYKRLLKDEGHLFVFCNDESYPVFYPVAYGYWDFVAALIWDKTRVGLGKIFRHQFEMILWASNKGANVYNDGNLHSDILSYPATLSAKRTHPVEKPPEMLSEIISICSKDNDLILDSFLGSGTTCVATKELGRRYIGIEINPDYVAIANKRLAQEVLPL